MEAKCKRIPDGYSIILNYRGQHKEKHLGIDKAKVKREETMEEIMRKMVHKHKREREIKLRRLMR